MMWGTAAGSEGEGLEGGRSCFSQVSVTVARGRVWPCGTRGDYLCTVHGKKTTDCGLHLKITKCWSWSPATSMYALRTFNPRSPSLFPSPFFQPCFPLPPLAPKEEVPHVYFSGMLCVEIKTGFFSYWCLASEPGVYFPKPHSSPHFKVREE